MWGKALRETINLFIVFPKRLSPNLKQFFQPKEFKFLFICVRLRESNECNEWAANNSWTKAGIAYCQKI
jgi:hypothetical protein